MMMCRRHDPRGPELTLALLAPIRQQMPLEHPLKLELAGPGPLEPLLGTGMSLDLGHDARLGFMP